MQDETATVIPFRGGALERAAWDRLWDAAEGGCMRRALGAQRARYRRRVQEELAVFARLSIPPGVLLELAWVVRDLADRGVTFGPGYGPQSGSLLLYLLGLSGIDPLEHGLPFLGFGRELEARRLHLRVGSRAEQAELASALRRYSGIDPLGLHTEALEVVVAHDTTLALTSGMARMAQQLHEGQRHDPLARCADPWSDPEALRLIARGEVEGVALLEGERLRSALRQAAPRTLEEVAQVVTAAREGAPQGLLERYVAARAGAEQPLPPHPLLPGVLVPTAGVWLYREQVVAALARLLQRDIEQAAGLAQRLAEESSERWEGALSQELGAEVAERWDLPHARGLYLVRALRRALGQVVDRASVLVEVTEAYRQAYYKAHYPAAFQAARLNRVLANVSPFTGIRYGEDGWASSAPCPYREAMVLLCREALRDGLVVLPPAINRSDWGFRALDRRTLLFGLGAVAQIDRAIAERLVTRRRAGTYRGLSDLVVRGFGGMAPVSQVEPLIFSGALDEFQRDRWQLRQQLDEVQADKKVWQYTAATPASPLVAGHIAAWHREPSGAAWSFQRELDVLGCAPSYQYFPEPAPADHRLRPVR
ncbi:MAG: hypothetical protein ACLFRW_07720 [Halorhodospira sp.]